MILLLAAGVAACAEDRAARSTVRDSAGVRIVESSQGVIERAAEWTIDSAPAVNIGEVEGDSAYQLFRVVGVARLADGRIAVLNAGSHNLRFFDAAGKHLRTVGRRGRGPGEFELPSALLHLPHDTLSVWDRSQNRITIVSPTGEIIRTARLEGVGDATNEILGVFADRSVLISLLRLDVPESGFKLWTATLAAFAMDGTTADTVGTFPWREIGILYREEGIIGSRTFAPRSTVAVHGERFWFGSGNEPAVEVRDRRGALRGIIRWDAGDRTIGSGDAAAYFEATSPSAPPERRIAFASIPVMDHYPAHGRLVADAAGNLWVERYPRPKSTEPTPWLVLDPEGAVIARANIPADFRVLEIGDDFVIGVRRDAEGVERVAVHALRRE